MSRPPHPADLTVALIHLLLQQPKQRVVVPCEQYVGRGYGLQIEFRKDGPDDTKLIVTLQGMTPKQEPFK